MMKYNQILLDKALALLPELIETPVSPLRTVAISRDEDQKILVKEAEAYQKCVLSKGDKICLDFGNHQVGYLKLKLNSVGSHADAPAWLRIHFAEMPQELLEKADDYHGWICSSWIEEEQIHVDVIPSEVALNRRFAFRYVEIEVLDISSKYQLVVEDALCTAVSSADDHTLLAYEGNDTRKNLDRIACRTLHNCMQKVFEDGPKRDRRLWMGDLRMQALANYETYKNNDLVKACLYLFAALPQDEGRVGACLFLDPVPEVDDTAMVDYSLFFIATLRDYYQATGDMDTLKELWTTALTQIYLAEKLLDERGIIKDSNQLGWCFVDWNLHLNKQASAQGIFLYCLKAAMEIASILNETQEQQELMDLYTACRRAMNDHLFSSVDQLYVSGNDAQISCASQVWAVLGGAIEGQAAVKLLKRMGETEGILEMVTPYMYHNYVDALVLLGEMEHAGQVLDTYWGGMAALGADTFWELYNPENPLESPYGGTIVNSYCHAWSCAPAYFYRKFF